MPVNKSYKIPDEELKSYKDLTRKLTQKDMILLGKYTTSFLQSLVTKKNNWENIKADMAIKCLKGKEYIHSIGKWNDYIEYLRKELC